MSDTKEKELERTFPPGSEENVKALHQTEKYKETKEKYPESDQPVRQVKTLETYKYNGKEYSIQDLKDRLYDDWGSTIYRTNAGGYSDAELDHAVSNLLDGMYDGTVTWNDKKHNFTLRGEAYKKQKNNEMYQNGSRGNYTIYNTAAAMLALLMDELEWFKEQEDEDEDEDSGDEDYNDTRISWGKEALGQAVFGEIFGNGGLGDWYELDELVDNIRPVTVRTSRIKTALESVRDNFDDIFTGYNSKKKSKALQLLDLLINLTNGNIKPNEWYYFSFILGNPSDSKGNPISWEKLMRTDFGLKEGETDELYEVRTKKEQYNKALNEYVKTHYAKPTDYNRDVSKKLDLSTNFDQNVYDDFRTSIQKSQHVDLAFNHIYLDDDIGKNIYTQAGITRDLALFNIIAYYIGNDKSGVLPFIDENHYGYYYDADKGTITKDWMFSKSTPLLLLYWMNITKQEYDKLQLSELASDDDIYNFNWG